MKGKTPKKDTQKKEEEDVIKRIEKIEIDKDDKEVDKVLNRATNKETVKLSREKISQTFRHCC